MLPILEFASGRIGRYVASPGGLGGECVDLVELWIAAIAAASIPGNAANLYANASSLQWQKVPNEPANFPPPGAIVVWAESPAAGISRYGHCAICLAADGMWLLTLDQNWPLGSPVRAVLHSYAGVVGWLIRRV